MRKTIDVAYEFLKEVKQASFNDIWKVVENELKLQWKEEFPSMLRKEIADKKIGQFYTILTIDGRFIKTQEDKWLLAEDITTNEARILKEHVGEDLDDELEQ